MKKPAFRPLFAAAMVFVFSVSALAQGKTGPQSLDQYPSFIELTSTTPDGAKAVLRCGYSSPNGRTVVLDPTFRELSVLNDARKSYSRIQRVDDAIIATSTDPTGGADLLLELVNKDGSVTARNCRTDPSTDSISNCHKVQPFTFADQIKAGDEKIASQCNDLLDQSVGQVNPSLANAQKTEAFKATLRQKVSILAAP